MIAASPEAMNGSDLSSDVFAVFAADAAAQPTVSLRGGDDMDSYREASAFDASLDAISDAYLERYWWGIAFLDPPSWRHYLPQLMDYALHHIAEGSTVVDGLLFSLRPPDREPPRLASLTPEQESVVTRFLEVLSFSETSAQRELACQVMEEWWIPGAQYRTST